MAAPFGATPATWFGLGAAVLLAVTSVSVVNETEQAVILRAGKPDRVINRFKPDGADSASGAGLALHIPLLESVVRLPRGLLTLESRDQAVNTADGQSLLLDSAVTVRVIDPVRLTEHSVAATERIATEISAWLPGLLKQELGKLDSGRMQVTGAGGAAAQLRAGLDRQLRPYGVQAVDVRITRAALPAGAQQETFQAMTDRREILAGEEHNRGVRDYQQITSEAEADAAVQLQASAGRDPEFYDFYRAMTSYEAIFAHPDRKDKATIVLPPDSGYLRQFNNR